MGPSDWSVPKAAQGNMRGFGFFFFPSSSVTYWQGGHGQVTSPLSVPQFPHLQNGDPNNSPCLPGLLFGFSKLVSLRPLKPSLGCGQHYNHPFHTALSNAHCVPGTRDTVAPEPPTASSSLWFQFPGISVQSQKFSTQYGSCPHFLND